MTEDAFEDVDWEAVKWALEGKPTLYKLWASKHASQFCGVGQKMVQMGFWESPACRGCQDEPCERTTHLFFCKNEQMVDAWKRGKASFATWLEQSFIDKDITECLLNTLATRAITRFEESLPSDADPALRLAAREQDSIGWTDFLEGKISKSWGKLLKSRIENGGHKHMYARTRRLRKEMVEHLLEITHDLWAARNNIIHERNKRGLLLAEAQALQQAIEEQFQLGMETLLPADTHFLDRGLTEVERLTPRDQRGWLEGIKQA